MVWFRSLRQRRGTRQAFAHLAHSWFVPRSVAQGVRHSPGDAYSVRTHAWFFCQNARVSSYCLPSYWRRSKLARGARVEPRLENARAQTQPGAILLIFHVWPRGRPNGNSLACAPTRSGRLGRASQGVRPSQSRTLPVKCALVYRLLGQLLVELRRHDERFLTAGTEARLVRE